MTNPVIAVEGLHALAYCERLYYLEHVEKIEVQNAAMFAGRRLHDSLEEEEPDGSWSRVQLESLELGLRGAIDVLRRRSGQLIPYEHKRGKSAGKSGAPEAWASDRLQVLAYSLLVEEAMGQSVSEARVRYHANGTTVVVPVDDEARAWVKASVERANVLNSSLERPPVAKNERLCARCSLAPVCLPEEARLAADPDFRPVRLFPPHPAGSVVHAIDHTAQIGRAGRELVIRARDSGTEERVPLTEVGQVVLHGFAQISTQALRLCADNDIGVHWVTQSGGLIGSLAPTASSAQRHLRQFRALEECAFRLALTRRLVSCKVESQLRFMLRSTRGAERSPASLEAIRVLREMLRRIAVSSDVDEIRGFEGAGAAAYFLAFNELLGEGVNEALLFSSRSRHPASDRCSVLMNYGYGMLYREVLQAIVGVGLHPGVGFFHQPRSSAHSLALDLMEIFRTPLIDMALVAALNRGMFDAQEDFSEARGAIQLSDAGRAKLIGLIERRKQDTWKHEVLGYSLSYARLVELEVRLLEKEWTGEPGLFARLRLR